MSDFEDKLANAIGAFKMQLDARPNVPSIERRQSGIITRESSFGSQLPDIRPQPSIEKRTPAYSITVSDFPTDPISGYFGCDFNGTLPLTQVVKTPNPDGAVSFIYKSEIKSAPSTTNPGLSAFYFYEAEIQTPTQSAEAGAPWSLFLIAELSVNPPDQTQIQAELCNIGVPKGDVGPGPDTTILLSLDWNISA